MEFMAGTTLIPKGKFLQSLNAETDFICFKG